MPLFVTTAPAQPGPVFGATRPAAAAGRQRTVDGRGRAGAGAGRRRRQRALWALLVLGFNQLDLHAGRAIDTLRQARDGFETTGQVDGGCRRHRHRARLVATGALRVAHEQLMALHRRRAAGAVAERARGVLLNAIAGSHSMRGDAESGAGFTCSPPPARHAREPCTRIRRGAALQPRPRTAAAGDW